MLSRTFAISILIIFLFSVFTCPGCASSQVKNDQITLQLNYVHSPEFIGYYVAEAKGFYRDAHIDVNLNEGTGDIQAWQYILDNRADFAVASFDEQQKMVQAGDPSVAVMAMFQIPPLAMFALADSGIKEPKDLIGKRIGIKSDGWGILVRQTLTNAGIDPSQIIEVKVSPDDQRMLYNHEVDVWTGFATDESVQAQVAGYKVNNIYLADYGIGGYEGLLITNEKTINQNPDLVGRFARASQKGLQYAIEQPDAAADVMVKWQPNESLDYAKLAIRALIPLVDNPPYNVGTIDPRRWEQLMGAFYNAQHPGYSMRFLEGK